MDIGTHSSPDLDKWHLDAFGYGNLVDMAEYKHLIDISIQVVLGLSARSYFPLESGLFLLCAGAYFETYSI